MNHIISLRNPCYFHFQLRLPVHRTDGSSVIDDDPNLGDDDDDNVKGFSEKQGILPRYVT